MQSDQSVGRVITAVASEISYKTESCYKLETAKRFYSKIVVANGILIEVK